MNHLGDGTFGVVYLAIDTTDNSQVAIKVFKGLDEQVALTFQAEIEAAQFKDEHPYVLSLLGAGKSQLMVGGEAQEDVLYVTSELAPNGDLFDFVEATKGLDDR